MAAMRCSQARSDKANAPRMKQGRHKQDLRNWNCGGNGLSLLGQPSKVSQDRCGVDRV
jgi:hypothetical protein